jgi:hypothetical protein
MAKQRATSRHPTTSGAADLSAPGDLSSSAASFARYLRAANIAPATLKMYAEAVRTLAGVHRAVCAPAADPAGPATVPPDPATVPAGTVADAG